MLGWYCCMGEQGTATFYTPPYTLSWLLISLFPVLRRNMMHSGAVERLAENSTESHAPAQQIRAFRCHARADPSSSRLLIIAQPDALAPSIYLKLPSPILLIQMLAKFTSTITRTEHQQPYYYS
ncbi:hypothetical protein SUGI_0533620 [Cryptomeria japonica]|nr:hypothetical protein SUGI_0533620 [Cryptomeria japonica]